MGYFKIKYPCGYEIETKMGIFDNFKIEIGGECPLHGKDCVKSKPKTKPSKKKK